ncbi:hypothetical protein [Micromonospora sp. HK10]|uniref:hypothetical protein n=1 Tax=Micromonospora sp. HK10 TaxID=1538294 RepID=UPI0006272887|nr:hypothetical protein [Micromonospora sp. HK10]KKJ95842.1 hypothetical protein LQ51_26270 [Micromonospora sp. HK10]
MGVVEPGLWAGVAISVAAVCALAFRLIREKIHADRDKTLVELALRDTDPSDRRDILEGLAELRPLNAQAARDDGSATALASALPGRRARRKWR